MEATGKNDAAAKAVGPTKTDFDLHVLLIMKQDDCNKSKALFAAYGEGLPGLSKRLGK